MWSGKVSIPVFEIHGLVGSQMYGKHRSSLHKVKIDIPDVGGKKGA